MHALNNSSYSSRTSVEIFCGKMILPSVVAALMRLMHMLLRGVYSLIYCRRMPNLPPIKNPLLKFPAATLAKKIRQGELSSEMLVKAYVERIKEVNPLLNAVIEDRFEAAVNDAKICDEKLKSGEVTALQLETERPLYGVPVTIKESCSVEGMSYTGCTVARRGVKAAEDGLSVEILKNAGAIPLCVTNTPEMCTALHTHNFLFGKTKNPYDRRKTVGGSSGGEGALVAAGASILGLGSDFVGSIRIPCHFNGIFGHKPTPGIIPIKGHFPMVENAMFQKYIVLGPIARYAEDLHLALKVLSTTYEKQLRLEDPVDLKTLRVFYIDNFDSFCGIRATTMDIRGAIKDASHHLAQSGACVEQFPKEWVSSLYNVLTVSIFGEDHFPNLCLDLEHPERKKTAWIEFTKAMFGQSQHTLPLTFVQLLSDTHAFTSPSNIHHYRNIREDLHQKLKDLLKDDGVLICPTYPVAASFAEIGLLEFDYCLYAAFANLMQLPATHVPMRLNAKGLPIGFQVMAGAYQDRLCLAVAKELEQEFGGWVPPPS
ncbi:fatty-acid amide hydrolase 2-B isoform X2 [Andrena cerasifolii]|uniref:fatty-acid amide hydrolase 2-B isoform X2 n=1 Tax=Andrena cerasifolii TaxID=2819439 RepID=UPI0040380B1E